MSRGCGYADADTSRIEAARLMTAKHVGSLIVAEGDKPVGIVMERDFLRKLWRKGKTRLG